MKKHLFLYACCLGIVVLLAPKSFAHSPGQPQVISINGQKPAIYFDPFVKSASVFPMADEVAIGVNLIHTPVQFLVDKKLIPLEQSLIDTLDFSWDFGDASVQAKGDKVSHTYYKPGSYLVKTFVLAPQQDPILLQITRVDVIPEAGYKLPTAKIMLDGAVVENNQKVVNFRQSLVFDASQSTAGSAPIATYTWSLAKDHAEVGQKLGFTFPGTVSSQVVVLEIKDTNGLIRQDYVQLSDVTTATDSSTPKPIVKQPEKSPPGLIDKAFFLVLGGAILAIIFFFRAAKKVQ